MSFVDPNQFIITRKRKKYKFALFHNSPLCFEFDEWVPHQVDVVEIGAGNGMFIVELATRHPEQVFVAVDVKGDRLQKGAREAEARGLNNVFFVRARADQLGELFTPNSLNAIWLTFSDPFLRKRSAGRRLTHPHFLKTYAELLQPDGSLIIKHDNPDFFNWSLEQLVTEGWCLKELTFDLHESDLGEDYKILTAYEQRWLSEGRIINFVKAAHR
ncbi:tRNA (guanine-N7)-methyltransferase [Candidatus Nanosynbacter lyticus]|uniref:tRNA (guanine-N(7)-)-methyltransferase n=1 Tax=Candidatus Nanosynbacter lyticus TaxID=2093824 RepID=A0A6S4GQL0_9BACT|nr:tRNA (guanosine(46)-N7)-methyltransferase TrmB [Candidatus Nanosynbacter lyticus]AJA06625.1 tRNA (guanine-N7)-methyltransferase [Candidatus Nanosynbacter lyticus]QCT41776.1 tRNA (guanosine(46)-N7)-methyltransferase TrmB [TM7 phylum sp. oral taxon 952]